MIRPRDRSAEPRAGSSSSGDESAAPAEHASPGLAAVVASLTADSGCRILDLGPAVPANIEYYGGFARHVRVVDAVQDLASYVKNEEDDEGFETLLDGIWRGVVGEFDRVMAWDLASHIDREVARSVVCRLCEVSQPGAKLFMLTYEGTMMPSIPQVFEIRSSDRLLYRPGSSGRVATKTLTPAEVERLLRGFRVESSFLLRHGVREYVAIRV